MKKVLIFTILLCIIGCNEVQKAPVTSVKPIGRYLVPMRQDWKDAYGETLESQMVYNLVIMRSNQMKIAKMISKLHPVIEPNEPIDPNRVKK